MEMFLTGIASFLGGSLLTALGFVFAFSNKVTAMDTRLKEVCLRFDNHLASPPVCLFHQKISEEVAVLKAEVKKV